MVFYDEDHGLSACPTSGTRLSHQWNAALPPVDHGFATRGITPHVLSCPTSCFLVKSTKSLHPAQNLCNHYEKQSVISAQPLRNPYATPTQPLHAIVAIIPHLSLCDASEGSPHIIFR